MSQYETTWHPNDDHLQVLDDGTLAGVQHVLDAAARHGLRIEAEVVTSRTPGVAEAMLETPRRGLPAGCQQWQLPVFSHSAAQVFFLSECVPNTRVTEHVHRDEDIFRVVVQGSIRLADGTELTAGDWMFVPRGVAYSYTAGAQGCRTIHRYGTNSH